MSHYHGLWYQCVASSSAACQISILAKEEQKCGAILTLTHT